MGERFRLNFGFIFSFVFHSFFLLVEARLIAPLPIKKCGFRNEKKRIFKNKNTDIEIQSRLTQSKHSEINSN